MKLEILVNGDVVGDDTEQWIAPKGCEPPTNVSILFFRKHTINER